MLFSLLQVKDGRGDEGLLGRRRSVTGRVLVSISVRAVLFYALSLSILYVCWQLFCANPWLRRVCSHKGLVESA